MRRPAGPSAKSFTTRYTGQSNVLSNNVRVTAAYDPSTSSPMPTAQEFVAVWDTGATNSVITRNVVDQCQLIPTGMANVNTAQGSHATETYLVGLGLPNYVQVPQLRVSRGNLTGCDVLIGMDIIGAGDFSVTSFGGKTTFSFRYPAMGAPDFVNETPGRTGPVVSSKVGRNDKCPCGSGKKYKRCHGDRTAKRSN